MKDLPLKGIAAALAAELRDAITNKQWTTTGALLRGIKSNEDSVFVDQSAKRLVFGEIAERFAAQVMPASPLGADRVVAATEKAIAASAAFFEIKETK
jgi:hypothetical protein